MKVCTKCRIEKFLEEFGFNKQMKDGRASWCRSCQRIAGADWEERNKDRVNAKKTKWRLENPEKAEESTRKWRDSHQDQVRESSRKAANRRYQEDPTPFKNSQHRRRASKKSVENTLTTAEWREILEDYMGLCFWCGDTATEQDHLIPISKGGGHTALNVVPSCRPCNARKKAKDPLEFLYQITKEQEKMWTVQG